MMSGKKFVILMFAGILATAAVMYTLYFLTRQLDYVPPDDGAVGVPITLTASIDRPWPVTRPLPHEGKSAPGVWRS